MALGVSISPMLTTNQPGLFGVLSDGLVQGMMYDDPASRFWLTNTTLASTETLPMWGGVAISHSIPLASGGGPLCSRALTNAAITGFSIYNQGHAAIMTSTAPLPVWLPGMTVPTVRFGSNARIAVAIDPAIISLDGGLITQQVSWDFNLQRLVPYEAAEAGIATTGVTWASTAGGTVTVTTASAHGLAVGNDVTLSGIVPSAYNGDVTVLTVPSSTTFTYALATNPGTTTTQGLLNAGGGPLACRILAITANNCITANYNATTGVGTWNPNAAGAIILI